MNTFDMRNEKKRYTNKKTIVIPTSSVPHTLRIPVKIPYKPTRNLCMDMDKLHLIPPPLYVADTQLHRARKELYSPLAVLGRRTVSLSLSEDAQPGAIYVLRSLVMLFVSLGSVCSLLIVASRWISDATYSAHMHSPNIN